MKEEDVKLSDSENSNQRIIKLEKTVKSQSDTIKTLSDKIKALEGKRPGKIVEDTIEESPTDIRVVILGMSLLGLVLTALFLFYAG